MFICVATVRAAGILCVRARGWVWLCRWHVSVRRLAFCVSPAGRGLSPCGVPRPRFLRGALRLRLRRHSVQTVVVRQPRHVRRAGDVLWPGSRHVVRGVLCTLPTVACLVHEEHGKPRALRRGMKWQPGAWLRHAMRGTMWCVCAAQRVDGMSGLAAAAPRARVVAYAAAAAGLVVFAIVELAGACWSSFVLQLAALAVLVAWASMESRVQQCLRMSEGSDGALPALVALAVALLSSAGAALSDDNGGHVFDTVARLGLKAANARFLLCAGVVPVFCQVVLMAWVAHRPGVHPAWATSAAVAYAAAWLVVVLWARPVPGDVVAAAVGATVVGLAVAVGDIVRCNTMTSVLAAAAPKSTLVALRDTRRLAVANPSSKGTGSGRTAVTMRDVLGSGVVSFGDAERTATLVTPHKSSVSAGASQGNGTPPGQVKLRPNRLPQRHRVARRASGSHEEESKQRPDLDLAAALSMGGVTNAVIAAASPSVTSTSSRRDSGSAAPSPDILRSTSSLMRSTRHMKVREGRLASACPVRRGALTLPPTRAARCHAQLVNAGEDVLMHRCVDILMAVKKKVPRTTVCRQPVGSTEPRARLACAHTRTHHTRTRDSHNRLGKSSTCFGCCGPIGSHTR